MLTIVPSVFQAWIRNSNQFRNLDAIAKIIKKVMPSKITPLFIKRAHRSIKISQN